MEKKEVEESEVGREVGDIEGEGLESEEIGLRAGGGQVRIMRLRNTIKWRGKRIDGKDEDTKNQFFKKRADSWGE